MAEKYRGFDREHTKSGKLERIYNKQVTKSKERGHALPAYGKHKLIDWAMSQELYHTLYDNWKSNDWLSSLAPSVDRKDDAVGYTIDNIQLMTWGENRDKLTNKIVQKTKWGELVATYSSVTEAEELTGIKRRTISNCLNGWSKSAGGFIWLSINGGA